MGCPRVLMMEVTWIVLGEVEGAVDKRMRQKQLIRGCDVSSSVPTFQKPSFHFLRTLGVLGCSVSLQKQHI